VAKKLFVGSLSWGTTSEKLSEFFSQAGAVISANVINDRYTGRSKGFGFVEMSTDEEAQAAIEKLNGQNLDGRSIVVAEAKPQENRDDNFPRKDFRGRDDRSRGGFSRDRKDNRRSY